MGSLFIFSFLFSTLAHAETECSIVSARFSPAGTQGAQWYSDDKAPPVKINVVGRDCAGKVAEISIVEYDAGADDDIAQLDDIKIVFPSSNTFSIDMKAGETDCEKTFGDSNDCDYFINITGADNFKSDKKPGGNLRYDCDGILIGSCDESWVKGAITRPEGPSQTPSGPATSATSTYELLAPLPCDPKTGACDKDGKFSEFDPSDADGGLISRYLNILIRIFIGICAVLAVMMMVIGGLEYMTSALPGNKESGKDRIKGAIFGLLLALGSWTLLNQINPNLLNTEMRNLTGVEVTVQLEDEGVLANENAPAPTGNLEAWARQYGKVLKMRLSDGTIVDLKPCDGTNLVTYNAFGTRFTLNKYLFNSIDRLNAKWQTNYKNYPMTSSGGYVCKVIMGKDGKPTKYVSYHSYGIAIDFNSAKNGRGVKGDMPPGFVAEWKKEGWNWGGDWKWTDPMHFGMGEGKGTIKGEK